MSREVAAHSNASSGSGQHRTIAWLESIAERHDLSLAPPAGEPCAAAILMLLDALSHDFADYREVVAGARAAGARNAEHLALIVRSTDEQGALVRATGAAATEAGNGASVMAEAAVALQGSARSALTAAADAGTNLAAIEAALAVLVARLADGDGPLAEMHRSNRGVAGFQLTLGRLSRHAQLLAVNAAIEAAQLAEAGSRFAIVAQEVRKLSTSTRGSKADVAHIVTELRQSTEHVASAVRESKDATVAAGVEVDGASDALTRTRQGIDEFERMVATIAEVAANQSAALQAIGSSVDQIWHHADGAASASREAAQLDLDSLLERAQTRLARWTLRDRPAPAVSPDADFARWIVAIVAGADAAACSEIDANGDIRPLLAALRGLLARVAADQRDVLADIVQTAVAVSRNGYAWRSISEALGGVNREIEVVRTTVHESVNAARTSAEVAGGMRALVDSIRHQYDSALELLAGALTRIASITGSVRDIDRCAASMGAAAARADQIMGLIDTLSSETDLLSLNAAIEAAHAGELGLGFSVIAEEIRSLARSTNDSTGSVTKLVASISAMSGNLQASIGKAAACTNDVGTSAEAVRSAIATLGAAFETAIERTADVSSSASDQTRALNWVLQNVNRSACAVEAHATQATDRERLELAMLGCRAHAIAARRPLGTVVERVRAFAETLSRRVEATFETALDQGRVTLDRLFDFSYHAVEGAEIASLARLFDVSRAPAAGFSPAKYAAPWDALVDEAIIDVLTAGWNEAAAANLSPVAIFISDLNGLFYAYPRQKIAAWTNDPATDNMGNRIKRFFEDEYTLRVVRCGLGPAAAELGTRRTYEQFRSGGSELARTGPRPWGGYVYARDTSAVCNEVVMAIYARDQRHGTLRICYDPDLI